MLAVPTANCSTLADKGLTTEAGGLAAPLAEHPARSAPTAMAATVSTSPVNAIHAFNRSLMRALALTAVTAAWTLMAPFDPTGLYRAPDKGTLPTGTTDVVVATARADPLRKAFAWVTLVGLGIGGLLAIRRWKGEAASVSH